ncbi:hypothetical protein RhiirA1_469616 [Rhizophagus irregularis]|uniref:Uncharacterized protein n=1 Tax=Rhizophagus irregularis TaxID=588596 RepID=A0A2N0R7P9_9GLOM|nr:hypothetical protein RhiirA1_469616 [Rhizophagus irregularis]
MLAETDANTSASSILTDIWKNILIDEGDFEFNPDNDNEENIALDNDFSTTTNIGSHMTETKSDEINWEDTDFEENFETESIITRLTDEEYNFKIKDTNILSMLTLTSCVIWAISS